LQARTTFALLVMGFLLEGPFALPRTALSDLSRWVFDNQLSGVASTLRKFFARNERWLRRCTRAENGEKRSTGESPGVGFRAITPRTQPPNERGRLFVIAAK
jgi:hypothetical protein